MKLYELERQARRLALPASQKAVLLCLISYSNRNGDGTSIFPSVALLARETSLCIRTVQYCLRELEVAGWIVAVNRRGGYGRPSLYHLNLDQFGGLAAQPIERPAPPQRSPEQRLNYARGMLRRLKEDSPARPKWEQIIADLAQLQANNLDKIDQAPTAVRDLPAIIATDQALVPLSQGSDIYQIGEMYAGLMNLQASEDEGAKKWWDYQRLLKQARDAFNRAMSAAGIAASDGQTPIIDDELEQQMQAWARRAYINQARRDSFTPGSEKWLKWNTMTVRAVETFNSLLYQKPVGGYIT